jgi:hypothetical protein
MLPTADLAIVPLVSIGEHLHHDVVDGPVGERAGQGTEVGSNVRLNLLAAPRRRVGEPAARREEKEQGEGQES